MLGFRTNSLTSQTRSAFLILMAVGLALFLVGVLSAGSTGWSTPDVPTLPASPGYHSSFGS